MTTNRTPQLPPERRDHRRTYPLNVRVPKGPGVYHPTATTHDIYYETFDEVVRHPGATSIQKARERAAQGDLKLPAVYQREAPRWPDDFLRASRLNRVLSLLGVLTSFRAVTNNQAAAFTGDPSLANPRSDLIAGLFTCGVLDLAHPYLGYSLGVAGGNTTAYQIGDPALLDELRRHLTWAEWFAVTGNRRRPTEAVNIRHDILAAELALRAAHGLRVGTVLGPHFSRFADLNIWNAVPKKGGPDLTIVRDDGLRIAIELTSSIGADFEQKVERWARLLSGNALDLSGQAVIFLVAPSPSADPKYIHQVRRMTYKHIKDAMSDRLGSSRCRTANRIGIATWREWFPFEGVASEHFARLTADRPTGSDPRWEPCNMWDPRALPFDPDDRNAMREIIPNAALLTQTPAHLRWPHQPARQVAALLRAAAGEPPAIPPRRERSGTRRPGVGQGVAGNALIPPRILGPADLPKRTSAQLVLGRPEDGDAFGLAEPRFGYLFPDSVARRKAA
ncbi:hypothetical protein [Nocardioides caricicola]|uniref:Uncharacterized protein n=1 Tax=Nocardioides caricicola TaxID=634770 RepID=A0ABW0N3X8_9ACTN